MIRFFFWQRWLSIFGIGVIIFGIMMAFLNGTQLFEIFNAQIDPVFWEGNSIVEGTRQFQHWVFGCWGATIAGWGIVLTFIVIGPFKRKEPWSWIALVLGLVVWFVMDTAISMFHKVYFNSALNTVFLVLGGLPLLFTRKEFLGSKTNI